MSKLALHSLKRLSVVLVAACVGFTLFLAASGFALANTVNIQDTGNILDARQVRSAASKLSNPVSIYTVPNFTGTNQAFDQVTKRAVNESGNPDMVIVAIKPHYVTVAGGSNVKLSQSQYNDAVNAFGSSYNRNNNYTTATIATLNTLNSDLRSRRAASPGTGGFSFGSTGCCIGLIALALIAAFSFSRRRSFGSRMTGFRPAQPPYQPRGANPQDPYGTSYPPQGSGYPPQNPGGGMNPWAAGGLGAAAGGLAGYELGKNSGDSNRERDENYGGGGAGGSFGGDDSSGGGGAGGSFGGSGNEGDSGFGGGAGGSFGSGSNEGDSGFGGGAGGSFGGGSNEGDSGFGGGAGGSFGGGGNDDGGNWGGGSGGSF